MRITIINCAAVVAMFFAVSCNESEEEEETVAEASVEGPGITEKKELSLDIPSAPNVYTLIEIVMFAYKSYPDVMNNLEAQGATAEQLWAAAWLLLEKGYSKVFIPAEGASLALEGTIPGYEDLPESLIVGGYATAGSGGGNAYAGTTIVAPNAQFSGSSSGGGGPPSGTVDADAGYLVQQAMPAAGGSGGGGSPTGVVMNPDASDLVKQAMNSSGGGGTASSMGQTTSTVGRTKAMSGNEGATSGQSSQDPAAKATKSIAQHKDSSKPSGSTATTKKEQEEITKKMSMIADNDSVKRTELANASKNNVCGDPVKSMMALCSPSTSSSCNATGLGLDKSESCSSEKGAETSSTSSCDPGTKLDFIKGTPGCYMASEKPQVEKPDFGKCNGPTQALATAKTDTGPVVFCVNTSAGANSL